MSENVEDIEGKLAAYVDGELTPAEKIEIETHLEQNPSHRALLHDLAWHRQLLRSLPREKAPGDCTEGFQGQLERDILLGGDELTRGRSRFKINYSPQLLSAAAIIILAVGLAIIVYSVLPPHHPSPHGPLAQAQPEAAKNLEPLADAASDRLVEAKAFKRAYPSEGLSKSGAGSLDMPAVAQKDEALGQKASTGRYSKFGTPQQEDLNPRDMMVITVTADDVKGANEAVLSYLSTNHIYFADASPENNWKESAQVMDVGRRLGGGGYGGSGLGGGGGGINGTATDAKFAEAPSQVQQGVDAVAKPDEALERSRVLAAKTEPQLRQQLHEEVAGAAAPRPDSFAKAPSTQPAAVALGSIDKRGGSNENNLAVVTGAASASDPAAGTVILKQQMPLVLAEPQNGHAKVILARNMNGQQVQDLAACLSQPERGQFASVSREVNDQYRGYKWAAPLYGEADRLLSLKSEVAENEVVLTAEARSAAAAIAPTTKPAEAALAIKANEAGISRLEADAPARKPGALIANDSIDSGFAFRQVAAPAASQQPNFSLTPTTQPFGGGRVDTFTCVIVLQDNAQAKAKAAATQPNAAKPSTAPAATTPPPENAK